MGALARARRAVCSDDRLAKQAAAGDIGAFEAIFSRYRDDLYRFCVGILREPQDAQDAVQNTMVKAMRALPGERRAMQLKPWLYRIAHNEAVELRRRERPVDELPVTVDDVGARTDERAEENGRLRTLLADIADLPERQRASLVLREVNGLGFGEIGATLGTSPGAVRQALYEARRGLAEMDNGRDMRCEIAARMISDADGRPRDRGVRAHLRDCSTCRRFQAEIMERGRAFAAISPMPVLAAAGALKAALGGSGAAAGGSGAAVVAGGTGAGAAGVAAGSIGATALLKPAAGLLAVLAIGTAAVDHGAIFEAGRHEPATAESARSAPALAKRADGTIVRGGHAVASDTGRQSIDAPTGERAYSSPAPSPGPASTAASGPSSGEPVVPVAPQPRVGGGPRSDDEGTAPTATKSSPFDDTHHDQAVVPEAAPIIVPGGGGKAGATSVGEPSPGQAKKETAETIPPGQAKKETAETIPPGQAKKETVPPGQAKKETVPPGQAKKETVPPGQAKKEVAAQPTTTESTAPNPTTAPANTPPGQAKKEAVPPGQAKKQVETTSEPTTSETSATETAPAEAAAQVPPGQAKKGTAETVPPGQAKAETVPPGQAKAETVPPGQAKKEEAATE